LLVDDHALFREGMRYVLQQLPEAAEVLEAGNFPDALKLAAQHPELELALMDLHMPGSEGAISIKFFISVIRIFRWWWCPERRGAT